MNGVIILARMDSSRLPGKALMEIDHKSLLEWCIESLQGKNNYKIIVATTDRGIDNPIVRIAKNNNIEYYRGSTNDVAKRILECARFYSLSNFARVNGDSPFVRKELIITAFDIIEKYNYDFVTNLIPRHFPYGIAVEVFKTEVFEDTYNELRTEEQREHVTKFFYENLSNYNVKFIKYKDGKQNDHNFRLVVDTKNDFNNIEKLISKINTNIQNISIENILEEFKNLKT